MSKKKEEKEREYSSNIILKVESMNPIRFIHTRFISFYIHRKSMSSREYSHVDPKINKLYWS